MNLNNMIHYCEDFNLPDPLSGIDVPAPINKNLVRSAIVVRCGLLTPIYGEPDVFTSIVSDWFKEKQWTFKHLIKVIEAEYSPIENVDEYSDFSDKRTRKDNGGTTEERVKTGTDATTDKYTNINTNTGGATDTNSGTDTTTNTIAAENSSSYQPDTQTEVANGKTVTNEHNDTDNLVHIGSGTKENSENETIKRTNNGSGNDDLVHSGRRHGNIGITTNQTLIEQELSLLRHFDIYKYIAEIFEADNMLMIY